MRRLAAFFVLFAGAAGVAAGQGAQPESLPPAIVLDTIAIRDTAAAIAARADQAESRAESCALGERRHVARAAVGAAFVGANAWLFRRFQQAWWSGEKSDGFFVKADWDQEFRDQDKFGHLFGGYHLTRAGHTLLRGVCVSDRKAVLYSALYATLFQLQIELWDAKYVKYGFSYPDLIANTAGMGLAVLHATRPATRVVVPTISYRRTAAMKEAGPADELRHSIDYSGQTYWFSLDVEEALPERASRYWPGLLRFSVGHSVTDWVLPRPSGADPSTPQQVVRGKRRILLSIDLDAARLPGNHPIWRFVKEQILHYIRLPAPALQIAPDVNAIGWYR